MEDRIQSDLKEAMKARDSIRVGTLRMLLAALKNRKIEKREELTEEECLAVVGKELKNRKEAAEQYAGRRPELAEKELAEAAVLESYLPKQLSEDEIRALVRETIESTGASDPSDLGKVMGPIMGRVKGRADGSRVRQVVQEELSR